MSEVSDTIRFSMLSRFSRYSTLVAASRSFLAMGRKWSLIMSGVELAMIGCVRAEGTGRKEMVYLTTHSTHFIYGYMASVKYIPHGSVPREGRKWFI